MDKARTWLILFLSSTLMCQNEGRGLFDYFSKPTTTTTPAPKIITCNCVCGKRNEGGRIVGGEMTSEHEYPWMVRLAYLDRFYCGGTLINDRYVLTAAHCIKGFIWFLVKVTFGEHDTCDKTKKPETRFVIRAIIGQFSFTNLRNDIAVLRLNDRVPINDYIRPVCLPKSKEELYVGRLATVAGWGMEIEGGSSLPCSLQEVQLPILSNEECKESQLPSLSIVDTVMCAGYLEGGKDSCQGDSGGPMFIDREDSRYEIIGITSWGFGCARPNYPGVYTRVNKYVDWIVENSKDGCFCNAESEPDSSYVVNEERISSTTIKPASLVTNRRYLHSSGNCLYPGSDLMVRYRCSDFCEENRHRFAQNCFFKYRL